MITHYFSRQRPGPSIKASDSSLVVWYRYRIEIHMPNLYTPLVLGALEQMPTLSPLAPKSANAPRRVSPAIENISVADGAILAMQTPAKDTLLSLVPILSARHAEKSRIRPSGTAFLSAEAIEWYGIGEGGDPDHVGFYAPVVLKWRRCYGIQTGKRYVCGI